MLPFTLTDGSAPNGYCDAPPAFVAVAKRTIVPPAQRNPSPNATPSPPACCTVPWKYSAELLGMSVPSRTTVSFAKLAVPLATSLPPTPSELRQPAFDPTGLELPHGHPAAEPSPK